MFGKFQSSNSASNIPLKSLSYDVTIYNALTRVQITQIYENHLDEQAIETQYYFAISPSAAFIELTVEIDGKKLSGSVKEKQKAREEYEKAKSEGKLAAIAEIVSEVHDVMKLNLGNLGPKTQAKVTLVYLDLLEISINKFWKFAIGNTFSSRSLGTENTSQDMQNVANPNTISEPAYLFDMKVLLYSSSPINYIVSPSHSNTNINQVNNLDTLYQINLLQEVPNKEFELLFANNQINVPAVRVGKIPSSYNELIFPYSAYITFFPGFDLQPVDNKIKGARIEFVFLVDRSGSMSGDRIQMTKNVLNELMDKLPNDSYFNIVSFGTSYQYLFPQSVEYNEVNKLSAKHSINSFDADFGGTEILQPLAQILQSEITQGGYDRVVFLLTDGQVYNENEIVQLIRYNYQTRIYAIGIGNGVSKNMIIEAAVEGQGKFEFVSELSMLSEKMQYLLDDAISPFLSNFVITFDPSIVVMSTDFSRIKIRKNEPFNFFCLMNDHFDTTTINLQYYDSSSNSVATQSIIIKKADAIETAIYHQISVHKLLRQKLNDILYNPNLLTDSVQDAEEYTFLKDMSIKYQVLTELTAIVLVDYSEDLQARANGQPVKIDVPLVESADYDTDGGQSNIDYYSHSFLLQLGVLILMLQILL